MPCTICGYDTDAIKPLATAKCLNKIPKKKMLNFGFVASSSLKKKTRA